MSGQAVVTQIQTYLSTLSGIKAAPEFVQDKPGPYPFAVAYLDNGIIDTSPAGSMTGLHNIGIEIHVEQKGLPWVLKQVTPFVDTIPNLLFYKFENDNKWNYTVSTIGVIEYLLTPFEWAGIPTFGIKFIVHDVKLQAVLTV